MSVIINDFEVVVEPTKPREVGERPQIAKTTTLTAPRPRDIEQILHRLMQRRTRLHAD
jgi:hypothetical protein